MTNNRHRANPIDTIRKYLVIAATSFVLGMMTAILIFGLQPAKAAELASSTTATQSYSAPASVELAAVTRDSFKASPHKPKHRKIYIPACKQEDSNNCFWDAGKRGNGEGESYIVYKGHVWYTEPDSNN